MSQLLERKEDASDLNLIFLGPGTNVGNINLPFPVSGYCPIDYIHKHMP